PVDHRVPNAVGEARLVDRLVIQLYPAVVRNRHDDLFRTGRSRVRLDLRLVRDLDVDLLEEGRRHHHEDDEEDENDVDERSDVDVRANAAAGTAAEGHGYSFFSCVSMLTVGAPEAWTCSRTFRTSPNLRELSAWTLTGRGPFLSSFSR